MKKFSSPPMIIILDILFVILFVLILESSPNIKIDFPQNKWIKDTVIVSLDKNGDIKHWYNRKLRLWQKFKTYPQSKRKFEFIVGNSKCNQYNFCKQVPKIDGEKRYIYIKGNLYDEVSGLITDSCLKFPKQCSNVTYHINENSEVDLKRLKKEHQIFRYILRK